MADNQFIVRKGLVSLDDSQITGSLSVTNAVTASFFTGSFSGDGTNLYNIPSSGVTGLNLDKIISGSVSASISPNNGFRINTDVYVDGTVTAKEIHIDYVTSSVLYQSGSTKFGDTNDDLHEFTGSVTITGSITLNGQAIGTGKLDETTFESFTSSYNTGSFTGSFFGDGSQLTGIDGFPFTGSAAISGSLTVDGNVNATSFTGSIQGTATTASYVNLTNVDGFTNYSSSVSSSINSVLDATTPITATINNTNSPFTITNQTIVIVDSTNGDVTINLPDLNTVVGTPNQRPIIIYKNDYSQNVVFVEPNGSQLVNGTTQDIIVSIQIGIVYNPTSAGWVTEGTSYQSLAELELFFVPRTETGSLSVSTASYVEYTNVANKPTLISGSSQITYSGLTGVPSGIVSGSEQITYSGLTGIPSGIVSSSTQITGYNVFATTGSNQFNGSQAITGSLTVTGQVIAQTLNVQQVTSSIVFSSGSNIFGNNSGNTHQFTGSLQVSGSSHYVLGNMGIGTITPLSRFHVNTGTNQNFRVRPGTDVGATNGVALNSRTDDDGSLQQLTLRASDVIMLTSGNVGIGTASPQSIFHIGASAPAFAGVKPYTGLSSTHEGFLFDYYYNTSAANLRVFDIAALGFAINGAGGSDIRFLTVPQTTTNTPIERLRITSGGNVGIGTASPDRNLEVETTGDTYLRVTGNRGDSDGLHVGNLEFYNSNSSRLVGEIRGITGTGGTQSNSGQLAFYTNDNATYSERMRIASDGTKYFGNPSGSRFQITASGENVYQYSNTYYIWGLYNDSNNLAIESLFAGSIIFKTAAQTTSSAPTTGTESMRINQYGQLLINATSSTYSTNLYGYNLGVRGNTNQTFISIARANQNLDSQGMIIGLDTTIASILVHDNIPLKFLTNAAERVRITEDGQLLVGMTSNGGSSVTSVRAGLISGQRTASGDETLSGWNQATAGDNKFVAFYTEGNGVLRGTIDYNRGAGLVRYNTTSDSNLKNIIGDSNKQKSIDILNSTKIREYSWKNDETNKVQIGVIAQELYETYKGAVSVGSDNELLGTEDYKPWGVDKTAFTFHLIAGFQEHEKIIKELQTQIESLKAEIQTLKQ
jgi:hypothetical protein